MFGASSGSAEAVPCRTCEGETPSRQPAGTPALPSFFRDLGSLALPKTIDEVVSPQYSGLITRYSPLTLLSPFDVTQVTFCSI